MTTMTMNNTKVVFTGAWTVDTVKEQLERQPPGPRQVLVKKLYTLVSPGTELACLSGGESWFKLPGVPGYAAVSRIVERGAEADGFEEGDIVFHYGKHTLYETVSIDAMGVFVKAPTGLDLTLVPFARMANVAITGIRVAGIELGDSVAVTGLGLVGNLAAQLAGLQGASVIGVDLSPSRRELAASCGVRAVLDGGPGAAQEIVRRTGGQGVSTLIEATGIPQVVIDSLPAIGKFGELVLLGSPRGEHQADVTDLLNYSHLFNRGVVTFKGAHEWRYPSKPETFVKHSLERNAHIIFDLMAQDKLRVQPLVSHILPPSAAPEAYSGLRSRKDEYYGVIFDWTNEQ